MVAQCRRRFTLLDAIILVAGFAVGLRMVEIMSPETLLLPYLPVDPYGPNPERDWTSAEWVKWALCRSRNRMMYYTPLLASLSGSALILRLLPPRPRRSRLMRRPGTVALTGVVAISLIWIPIYLFLTYYVEMREPWEFDSVFEDMFLCQGSAVIAGWGSLLLAGRWRAEPEWQDRLGRLLGILWIVPFLLWIGLFVYSMCFS